MRHYIIFDGTLFLICSLLAIWKHFRTFNALLLHFLPIFGIILLNIKCYSIDLMYSILLNSLNDSTFGSDPTLCLFIFQPIISYRILLHKRLSFFQITIICKQYIFNSMLQLPTVNGTNLQTIYLLSSILMLTSVMYLSVMLIHQGNN